MLSEEQRSDRSTGQGVCDGPDLQRIALQPRVPIFAVSKGGRQDSQQHPGMCGVFEVVLIILRDVVAAAGSPRSDQPTHT
jgi:hypothetical protein